MPPVCAGHRPGPGNTQPAAAVREEGADTTHFSILDREGSRVAATLSINYSFGSGFVPPGTGVLLNDEMDDFSAQLGVPNAYGLIGGEANAISPGKRMLSGMTPAFAESERGLAILGMPGGSRIVTTVLRGLLSLDASDLPAAWVAKPRFPSSSTCRTRSSTSRGHSASPSAAISRTRDTAYTRSGMATVICRSSTGIGYKTRYGRQAIRGVSAQRQCVESGDNNQC